MGEKKMRRKENERKENGISRKRLGSDPFASLFCLFPYLSVIIFLSIIFLS